MNSSYFFVETFTISKPMRKINNCSKYFKSPRVANRPAIAKQNPLTNLNRAVYKFTTPFTN